jgi:hypothetical protein
VGIGYEFIMLAGKHDNFFTRLLSAPGLWMQRITTKEPDEAQLAIAICAIKSAMPEEFPDFTVDEYAIDVDENLKHFGFTALKKEEVEEKIAKLKAQREASKNSVDTPSVSEDAPEVNEDK